MHVILPLAIGLVALLYASVGHAGATGYIAVMTLLGMPPAAIRPTALLLNVIVATIASVQFFRAGHFRPRLFWPLVTASVPSAFIGGTITLPTIALEAVLGGVLLAAAARMLFDVRRTASDDSPTAEPFHGGRPPILWSTAGGAIGFLSGLTGVGGGVFLTPALVALGAAPVKTIAAVTAPFILVNSLAGLGGGLLAGRPFPAAGLPVIAAAVLGGVIGSHFGAFRLPPQTLRLLMAAVLAIASIKLLGRPLGL
jgi:uncharacterized membrane protein YfcA